MNKSVTKFFLPSFLQNILHLHHNSTTPNTTEKKLCDAQENFTAFVETCILRMRKETER